MKTKYIFVSYNENNRSAELSYHAELPEAQHKMMVQFAEAYRVSPPSGKELKDLTLDELIRICEEETDADGNGDAAFGEISAWVNDGTNHSNYDWEIIPVGLNADGELYNMTHTEMEAMA